MHLCRRVDSFDLVSQLLIQLLFRRFNKVFSIIFVLVCMSISIVSLNARGLCDNVKRKALFLYAKSFKTDFCFFRSLTLCSKTLLFGKINGAMRFGWLMVPSILLV